MRKLTMPLLCSTLLLSACGDSGWNPFGWFSGNPPQATLEPDAGYDQSGDLRPVIGQITQARWEPLNEGRLLVVTAMTPTKGYSSVELITARAQPAGRISPDSDGVLRLRLVGRPPAPDNPAAGLIARPETDGINTALALSSTQLAPIIRVEITSAANAITLTK
ncbi:hypothetical protein PAF17_19340 [Paracoccus sp. Z330]|uniref:Lipoprotein n=1 Tax=Paracoccus onchidii TaxID=3017813 RepID=A0ABT4ZK06_9RHOB|nr:hypothetical protein [Paracoccus onchidii]MDB6179622.1 hypothetical protein [Paracoccus onchidii]